MPERALGELTDDERLARELHLQLNAGPRRRTRLAPSSSSKPAAAPATRKRSQKRSRTKYDDSDDDGVSSGSNPHSSSSGDTEQSEGATSGDTSGSREARRRSKGAGKSMPAPAAPALKTVRTGRTSSGTASADHKQQSCLSESDRSRHFAPDTDSCVPDGRPKSTASAPGPKKDSSGAFPSDQSLPIPSGSKPTHPIRVLDPGARSSGQAQHAVQKSSSGAQKRAAVASSGQSAAARAHKKAVQQSRAGFAEGDSTARPGSGPRPAGERDHDRPPVKPKPKQVSVTLVSASLGKKKVLGAERGKADPIRAAPAPLQPATLSSRRALPSDGLGPHGAAKRRVPRGSEDGKAAKLARVGSNALPVVGASTKADGGSIPPERRTISSLVGTESGARHKGAASSSGPAAGTAPRRPAGVGDEKSHGSGAGRAAAKDASSRLTGVARRQASGTTGRDGTAVQDSAGAVSGIGHGASTAHDGGALAKGARDGAGGAARVEAAGHGSAKHAERHAASDGAQKGTCAQGSQVEAFAQPSSSHRDAAGSAHASKAEQDAVKDEDRGAVPEPGDTKAEGASLAPKGAASLRRKHSVLSGSGRDASAPAARLPNAAALAAPEREARGAAAAGPRAPAPRHAAPLSTSNVLPSTNLDAASAGGPSPRPEGLDKRESTDLPQGIGSTAALATPTERLAARTGLGALTDGATTTALDAEEASIVEASRKAASKFLFDMQRDSDIPAGCLKCFYSGQRFGIWLPVEAVQTRQLLAAAINSSYAESIKSVGKGDRLSVIFLERSGSNHLFPPRKLQPEEKVDKNWRDVCSKASRVLVNLGPPPG